MTQFKAAWLERQRKRWMRPDARRYFRPDFYDRKYSPDQPRVPAGGSDGGQWTAEGGADRERSADGDPTIDLSAQRRGAGDGHHYVPQSMYNKLPLPAETRKVFEDSKTGRLFDGRSNMYDRPHRIYNNAVTDLFEQFTSKHEIQPERMTPDQARSFLKEVHSSGDPRIKHFNMQIQMREIMQRLFRRSPRNE